MTIQAIITKTVTTTATFSGKPDESMRKRLVAAGYKFDKGRWFRSESESQIVSEAEVSKNFVA
jgi:hypothetical protein